MELNAATFLWLRDVGGLPSTCAAPVPGGRMVKVQAEGLQRLVSGAPLVRALHHYCCDRFGVPKDLFLAVVEEKSTAPTAKGSAARNTTGGGGGLGSASASSSLVVLLPTVEAARRHNWQVVHRIVQEGLRVPEGLDEHVITAITERGDTLEALLATKRVYELLEGHRHAEKLEKARHVQLSKDVNRLGTKRLLHKKPVDASLLKSSSNVSGAARATAATTNATPSREVSECVGQEEATSGSVGAVGDQQAPPSQGEERVGVSLYLATEEEQERWMDGDGDDNTGKRECDVVEDDATAAADQHNGGNNGGGEGWRNENPQEEEEAGDGQEEE